MHTTTGALRHASIALGVSAALLLGGTAAQAHPASVIPAASDATAVAVPHRDLPRIAGKWAAAWNSGDAAKLAALFTADGIYTDHAFGASFTGPDGVAQWATITAQSIADVRVDLRRAVRYGNTVVVSWTFSGHIVGAPSAFAVPAVTVMRLRGGKIQRNDDYYSLAEVKRQSGLSADFDFTA